MILVYLILSLHVLLIYALCRAAARGDRYEPTKRQRRQWRRERLVLDIPNRRRQ